MKKVSARWFAVVVPEIVLCFLMFLSTGEWMMGVNDAATTSVSEDKEIVISADSATLGLRVIFAGGPLATKNGAERH